MYLSTSTSTLDFSEMYLSTIRVLYKLYLSTYVLKYKVLLPGFDPGTLSGCVMKDVTYIFKVSTWWMKIQSRACGGDYYPFAFVHVLLPVCTTCKQMCIKLFVLRTSCQMTLFFENYTNIHNTEKKHCFYYYLIVLLKKTLHINQIRKSLHWLEGCA